VSDPNRRRMLEIVRKTWINGYLKHSLDNVVRIELGLEEKPANPDRKVMRFPVGLKESRR
jgi:hypothetical protein